MFCEFNNHPYYALIYAQSEEEAIAFYNEIVCELEDEDKESCPDKITKGQVIAKIKNANFESEYQRESAIKDLEIKTSDTDIILIDSSLM